MNHKHRKVLHALFAHPVSANILPKAVEAVFGELGGEIEQRHGGRIGVRLNGHFAEFAHPQHSMHPIRCARPKNSPRMPGSTRRRTTRCTATSAGGYPRPQALPMAL